MKNQLEVKTIAFVGEVTSDSRWNIEDELLIQVLGFTLYGYAFGIGRMVCMLVEEEIIQDVVNRLVELGVGVRYAEGLVNEAHNRVIDHINSVPNEDAYSQLVSIGHSYFGQENIKPCIESIFSNTAKLS